MDQAVSENTSIYRPKINRDASTRDDVYNLEDLVPSDIINTLQTAAINVINNGDLSQFVYVILLFLQGPLFITFNISEVLLDQI